VHSSVSVVIATYNYGRYLPGTLDSLLAQTFTDWEAVVIDDGSTDNTQEVIRPYLEDPRIRYHRSDHVGQPAAKNLGIELTHNSLIAFLDADDLWLPEKLERQVALFRDDPRLGVAYARRLFMDQDGWLLDANQRELHRGMVLTQMFQDNFVCFSSSMVRRAVFDDVGRFDEAIPMAIDYDLWLRVARRYRFDYVDEPQVLYRTGHANLSQRGEERLGIALGIMRRFLDEQGGRNLLCPTVVRRAFAETYAHVALGKRDRQRMAAVGWLLRALMVDPCFAGAWRELASALMPESVRRVLRRALRRPVQWRSTPRRLSSSGQPISATSLQHRTPDDIGLSITQ